MVIFLKPIDVFPILEIKRVGETALGVVTQCLVSSKLEKFNKVYCAHVCLKINVKLGGINFVLAEGQMPYLESDTAIIMGADVVHSSLGKSRPGWFSLHCIILFINTIVL